MELPTDTDERVRALEDEVYALKIRGKWRDATPLIEEIAALKAYKDDSGLTVDEHRSLQAKLNSRWQLCREALNAGRTDEYEGHLAQYEAIRKKLHPEKVESVAQLQAGALRPRM